jgi:hypothetical protein
LGLFDDRTLFFGLDGALIGHVQPSLVEPEFYQTRQRRLTAEIGASITIPEACLVDSVIEPGARWWVMCRSIDGFDPTVGTLSADGRVEVVAQIPTPTGREVVGHWREVFVRADGALLAQFSGECEVPHAMFVINGEARHLDGSAYWDEARVPDSYAYGWLPDGRALVWIWGESGCGSSDPEPGLYAYDLDGSRELLFSFEATPFWGRMVESSPAAAVHAQLWLRGQFGAGVFGSDGTQFVANPLRSFFIKTVAWDHGEGFVYLSEDGAVRWWRPDADTEIVRFDGPTDDLAIVDVSLLDRQVVIVERNGSLLAFDLITGAASEGAVQRYRRVETGEISFLAGGRTAVVIRDELIVTHQEGLLRLGLGGPEQPFVVLHDFDGRRVIVSIEALEPADAPRTVYIIDLECPTCTEVIETITAQSFDLVGNLSRSNPIAVPQLDR